MSENPFASPTESTEFGQPVKPAVVSKHPPGALQIIAILCLILGILGLLTSCATGIGLAFQGFAMEIFENSPASAQNEVQKLNLKAAMSPVPLIGNGILAALNLGIASMLIIGGIGVLQKKESGRNMLRFGTLLAIVYNVLKMILAVVGQLIVNSNLGAAIDAYEGPVDKEEMQTLFEMTKLLGIGGAVFAAVICLALIGFYFWARGYLNREEVVNYIASFAK